MGRHTVHQTDRSRWHGRDCRLNTSRRSACSRQASAMQALPGSVELHQRRQVQLRAAGQNQATRLSPAHLKSTHMSELQLRTESVNSLQLIQARPPLT